MHLLTDCCCGIWVILFHSWVGCGVFVARAPVSDYGLWISSLEGCFLPVFTLGLECCRLFLHVPASPSALFSLYFYTIKRRFPHILDPLPVVVWDAHIVAGSREFSQFSCSSLSLGCESRPQEWGCLNIPALPSWQPNPAFLVGGKVLGGREFPHPPPALRSRLLPEVQHPAWAGFSSSYEGDSLGFFLFSEVEHVFWALGAGPPPAWLWLHNKEGSRQGLMPVRHWDRPSEVSFPALHLSWKYLGKAHRKTLGADSPCV